MGRKAVKWKRVYRSLRAQLISLSPGTPLGRTIDDLAADFDVNHKTIKRALDVLKSEKLLAAKPGVGLRAHPNRPSLSGDGRWILYLRGRCLEHIRSDTLFLRAVKPVVEANGYGFRGVFDDELADVDAILRDGLVIGVITSLLNASPVVRDAIADIKDLGIPVCNIDEIIDGVDSVIFDNRAFGRLLGRMLLSNPSFKRVIVFQHPGPNPVSLARENGIREIIDEMKASSRRVWWTTVSVKQIDGWLSALAEQNIRFDACCLPDMTYLASLKSCCRRIGIPLPYTITIALHELLWFYRISGVTVPIAEMSLTALNTLLDRMTSPMKPARVIYQKPGICYEYTDEPPAHIKPIIHLFPPRPPR